MDATPPPLMTEYPRPTAEIPSPGKAVVNGASWLYWIGGLSLVSSIPQLLGNEIHFMLGLGFTAMLNYLGHKHGGLALGIVAAIDLLVCGFYLLLGYFATRGKVWAFGLGIALLVMDTMLLMIDPSGLVFSIAFHAWALFALIHGLRTRAHEIRSVRTALVTP